jgi:hypothetical protein
VSYDQLDVSYDQGGLLPAGICSVPPATPEYVLTPRALAELAELLGPEEGGSHPGGEW